MLPLPFAFERPSTIDEALGAVGEDGEGMFYSGGTELLLAMKMRVIHTERLVDIKGISGLDGIAMNGADEIEIGARCTHKKIAGDAVIRKHVPAMWPTSGSAASGRSVATYASESRMRIRRPCWQHSMRG
jgi:carbon-monoxide dehydrogenase medium subunit